MAYAAAVIGWGNLLLPSQSDTVALERSLCHRGAPWGHRDVIAQGVCSASGGFLAGTIMSGYPGRILSVVEKIIKSGQSSP